MKTNILIAKNNWEFLKEISINELKQFLSLHNTKKEPDNFETFKIESYENEFRIELYNSSNSTKITTQLGYIDFLSDFMFCVEIKNNDSKYLTRELLKLFIQKFEINYINKYLDDYKSKLNLKYEEMISSSTEITTLASLSISKDETFYVKIKKQHEDIINKTNKILNKLYNETKKELYSILNEIKNK